MTHLTIAQQAGCARLWTNDSRLAAVAPELAVDALASA